MQNMPRLAAPVAIAAWTLSACATTAPQTARADASDVALGEQAYVDGPIIQPVEVLEDSRCPKDTFCIWPGRVRVKMLWIRGSGEKHPFEIILGESTQIADGNIRLESVQPARLSNVEPNPADYRFSFRFAGGL